MENAREFQKQVQRIGDLVQQFENTAAPELRASAKELVRLLMQLHGSGLEQILETTFQSGETGRKIIDELGHDSFVGNLLILHGLHPDDFEIRVQKAVEKVSPQLRKNGAEIEISVVQNGLVHLLVRGANHSCGSTKTMKTLIEQAIYDAAPDLTSLTIEGLDRKAAAGFVAVESLRSTNTSHVAANGD